MAIENDMGKAIVDGALETLRRHGQAHLRLSLVAAICAKIPALANA
jgi:hypothetical protein